MRTLFWYLPVIDWFINLHDDHDFKQINETWKDLFAARNIHEDKVLELQLIFYVLYSQANVFEVLMNSFSSQWQPATVGDKEMERSSWARYGKDWEYETGIWHNGKTGELLHIMVNCRELYPFWLFSCFWDWSLSHIWFFSYFQKIWCLVIIFTSLFSL